ncbi:MAG: L-aspartate oxidase [Lachnospiraceae bacterium]|nr:L-aspartate oxidase [Lachnospiraceae bacterium]
MAKERYDRELYCDIVIAGCGVAGLYTALTLPQDKKILMLSKEDVASCDSMLAQGGICVLRDDNDFDAYYEDTMRAGHYENRPESVEIMINSSRDIINHLLTLGVRFERNADGSLAYTREGAHSRPRICFHKDITGEEITTTLLSQVRKLANITIMEYTTMTDIMEADDSCVGIQARDKNGAELRIYAQDTVMATGGIGGLYQHSTNFPLLTGDACRIAKAHRIKLAHMDYVQIHPTCLYSTKPGRSFLISESARGEGAIIINHKGERFVDELLPRDVVTDAILKEMEKEGAEYEYLSFENVPENVVREHFPNIYKHCLDEGYDLLHEPVPIVPAQHYFMGGVHVDSDSQTTMAHLYAVGETCCNGVHGKNRLASNSLLESLVFAKRAAAKITQTQVGIKQRNL